MVRQEQYGPNVVAAEKRASIPAHLARLLINPLNVMLLVLAATNFIFLDDIESGSIVTAMIVLSVSLCFIQEHRSGNAAEKLRAMVSNTASVLRWVTPEGGTEQPGRRGANPAVRCAPKSRLTSWCRAT